MPDLDASPTLFGTERLLAFPVSLINFNSSFAHHLRCASVIATPTMRGGCGTRAGVAEHLLYLGAGEMYEVNTTEVSVVGCTMYEGDDFHRYTTN